MPQPEADAHYGYYGYGHHDDDHDGGDHDHGDDDHDDEDDACYRYYDKSSNKDDIVKNPDEIGI